MSRSVAVAAVVVMSLLFASVPARAAPTGYAAVFAGQSRAPTVGAGETATLIVFFANTGERTWERGAASQVDLAMCTADRASCDVRDATRTEWDPGSWHSASRYATQRQPSVARGQLATFVFSVRPAATVSGGTHRFPAELVLGQTGERITTSTYGHEVTVRAAPLAPIAGLMLDESDLGTGFVRVQDRPLTADDRAEGFADRALGKATIATWGFVDGARRWYSKEATRGVHSVFHHVYRYASTAGAQEDLKAVRAANVVAGSASASISTIGEDSVSYLTSSTGSLLGPLTQATVASRYGASVSVIFITAVAGELSLEYAETLAIAQATKAGWRQPVTVPVPAAVPTATTVGGIAFHLDSTSRRQVFSETTVPVIDAQRIAAALDSDLAALEALYARRTVAPLQLYAFADAASFERGLVSVFSMTAEQAHTIATVASGVHLSRQHKIALNWERLREVQPLATIRHELSHFIFQDVVGYPGIENVPAWFNEGIAETAEWTYGRVGWLALNQKYLARSSASAGLLPSLASMTTLEQFQTGTEAQLEARYAASSQAAAMIVNGVGYPGVIRILDAMRAGATFEVAFERVYGSSLFYFAMQFGTAMRTFDGTPGLAAVSDTPRGQAGLFVALHGFRPFATISVRFSGSGEASLARTADAHGFDAFFYLPGRVAPGTYTIDASDGLRSATLVITVTGVRVTEAGATAHAIGSPEGVPARPAIVRVR